MFKNLQWLLPYVYCCLSAYLLYSLFLVVRREPGATIFNALAQKWYVYTLVTAYLLIIALVGRIRRKRKEHAQSAGILK